jgi:hypothetical protein
MRRIDDIPVPDEEPGEFGVAGTGQWSKLFERHPEGGGPFGGRDNALTKLLGFLRAKSIPFDVAVELAKFWNGKFVDPPMDPAEVHRKISRGWVQWLEGGLPDATPDNLGTDHQRLLEFIDLDRLGQLAAEAGGVEWIVEDLILSGGIHFITAPPGGGKTWAAIDLVRACMTGTKWLDHKPAKQVPVLYINEEMGAGPFFQRLDQMRVPGSRLSILQRAGINLDNPSDLSQIADHIRSSGVRIVVLDTFVRVHSRDENNNSEMAQLFGRFKAITDAGAAIVCLHHHRKSGSGSPVEHEAMRGAGEIAAQADLIAAIDKIDGIFRFRVTKHRHLEESAVPAFGFAVDNQDDGSAVIIAAELEMAEEGSRMPNAGRSGRGAANDPSGRILSVLAENTGLTENQLAKLAKVRRENVPGAMAKLESDGLVFSILGDRGATVWHRSEF